MREKFTLQSQVNENLVQISSLRTQLDDMRYRRGIPAEGDTPDAAKRLEMERERSEDKDQQVGYLVSLSLKGVYGGSVCHKVCGVNAFHRI